MKKINFKKVYWVLAVTMAIVAAGFLVVYAATSYQVNYNATVEVDEHSTCKKVTNGSGTGLAIFVPTNTTGEWSAFRENLPSGVTLADCFYSPLAWWKLDETSGTSVADSSANSNTGTNTSASVNQAGQDGTSYYFGGSAYVRMINESTFDFVNDSFSVSGWFKVGATANRMMLVAKGGFSGSYQWAVEITASNSQLLASFSNTAGTTIYAKVSGAAVDDGTWHHFVATFSFSSADEDVKLYLDGVEQTTALYDTRVSNNYSDAVDPVMLGTRGSASTYDSGVMLTGYLDDVRVYSEELTSAEASTLYNSY